MFYGSNVSLSKTTVNLLQSIFSNFNFCKVNIIFIARFINNSKYNDDVEKLSQIGQLYIINEIKFHGRYIIGIKNKKGVLGFLFDREINLKCEYQVFTLLSSKTANNLYQLFHSYLKDTFEGNTDKIKIYKKSPIEMNKEEKKLFENINQINATQSLQPPAE